MWKIVVFVVLIVLYLVSYLLEVKYDDSPSRKVFAAIWVIILLASVIFPLVAFDGWWKLLVFVSVLVIYISTFHEGNNYDMKKNGEFHDPIGFMVSYGGHFLLLQTLVFLWKICNLFLFKI